jgi:Tol biopolymer transport system component
LSPAFSPDGSKVVVARWDPNTNGYNLWENDLKLESPVRLTSGAWFDGQPVWSPDGHRLVYSSSRNGTFQIFDKDFSGTGEDKVLHQTGARIFPHHWSAANRLIYTEEDGSGPEGDIWSLPLDGSPAEPLFRTGADETQGRISPDGRWIAFASDESGRWEIYVRSLSPDGIRRLVSSNGGTNPLWRNDSRELFYFEPDDETRTSLAIDQTLMSVEVSAGDEITLGTPRSLFRTRTPTFSLYETWAFSVTGDGQTFVINQIVEETEAPLQVAIGSLER